MERPEIKTKEKRQYRTGCGKFKADMANLSLFIVIYNQIIENLPTTSILKQNSQIPFYYFDNSTKLEIRNHNSSILHSYSNAHYYTKEENIGLSKAYNYLLTKAEGDYFLFLDQDTMLPKDYLAKLSEECDRSPSTQIFFPLVYSNESIMSPVLYEAGSFKPVSGLTNKQFGHKEFLPINSGTCVNKNVFALVGKFNENQFLDFVDYEFYDRCSQKGIIMQQLPISIQQSFSGSSFPAKKENALTRFTYYLNDSYFFFKNKENGFSYYKKILNRRCIRLTIHYHCLDFYHLFRSKIRSIKNEEQNRR
jgi:rhamnosyltransferase